MLNQTSTMADAISYVGYLNKMAGFNRFKDSTIRYESSKWLCEDDSGNVYDINAETTHVVG